MATVARIKELVEQGDRLFTKRRPLLNVWQAMAEQFYPIRADFTASRHLGDEFAAHLMTGRPLLAQRDLGNALSSMLRPRGKPWFWARTSNEDINDDAQSRQWLDEKSDAMRRLMYGAHTQFVRATKQGDNDFVAFGQCVIEPCVNHDLTGLLYRNWHLRDCVWSENSELRIDVFHREWKIEAREMIKIWPKTVSQQVKSVVEKEPFKEIKCRHIVMPCNDYDFTKGRVNKEAFPFVSIVMDIDNQTILEETPRKRLGYVIPRWVTISGSQYAYSPATVIALPDARMLQNISLTLLEAGQKTVDPPLKATQDGIVGGVNWYPGGVTWVDREYDEKMGAALEPLLPPVNGLGWGEGREQKIETLIAEAFYLNKIGLPPADTADMTAYETRQRIEEYIRGALPLFEPMEVEYNGALCEETWHLCMDFGAFGSIQDMVASMPDMLKGRDIRWEFESPLQAASERGKSEAFVQAANLLKIAVEMEPSTRRDFDASKSFREALRGTGAPADWIVPEEQAAQIKAQDAQQAQAQAMAQAAAAAGQLATNVGQGAQDIGRGMQDLQGAGIMPHPQGDVAHPNGPAMPAEGQQ